MKARLVLLTVVFASFAMAVQITSTCNWTSGTTVLFEGMPTATGTTQCAAFAALPPGSTINWIRMEYAVDLLYTPTESASDTFAIFTVGDPGTLNNVAGVNETNLNRPIHSFTTGYSTAGGTLTADVLNFYFDPSGWSVQFEISNPGGLVQGNAFAVRYILDYDLADVPEATTMALVGMGLLGLGFAARRRLHI